MYRSLAELRDSINRLIEQQGANAPCVAFVFTKDDVFYYELGDDGFEDLDVQKFLNDEDTEEVLEEVGDSDYIYEQINEIIEDEVKRVRNKVTP